MSAWQPAGSVWELSGIFASNTMQLQPSYPHQPINQYVPPRKNSATGWWIAGGVVVGIFLLFVIIGIATNYNEGYYEDGYYENGTVTQSVFHSKFSNLPESEKERAISDLTKRMDNFFLRILKNDEALMQLIVLAAMSDDSDYNLLDRRFGKDVEKIFTDWANTHRLNLDDRGLAEYLEYDFPADYMLHLVSLLMNDFSYY
jgi:hypothetical protein